MSTSDLELGLRLQAIIDTAIDGIITIDSQGIIETINQSAAALFQYEPSEIIGSNIHVLMPEPFRSKHDDYIKRYQESRQARIIGIGREVEGLKRDGTLFPFRLAVSEVQLKDRRIYTGIIHDLSEVKSAQDKLVQINQSLEGKVEARTKELEDVVNTLISTNRKLKEREQALETALDRERELNELKSRFVSMASHEFRTPLSTILSSSSLIARYTSEEQQLKRLKHVERIKASVTNLTGILNDFLSLEKLEQNKVDLNLKAQNVSKMCTGIVEDLQGLIKPGQRIIHQVEGTPRSIMTDERVFTNILFNLLSNAIKYSPPEAEILCKITFEADQLRIEIIDRGIGIPRSEQKHLFERFFRASNVETVSGTGLGLNIVLRYLDLLQGQIFFESEQNVGTTFTVTLPFSLNSKKRSE